MRYFGRAWRIFDIKYILYVLKRFPKDVRTYGIDKQFLWGKSLLVTPVLDPGVDYVDGYFPEGLWYDYYTVRPTILLSTFSIVYSIFTCGPVLPRATPCPVRVKKFDFTLL